VVVLVDRLRQRLHVFLFENVSGCCSIWVLKRAREICSDSPGHVSLLSEEWRPLARFDGVYEVSDWGRVRRAKPGKGTHVGKILKAGTPAGLYPLVVLSIGGVTTSECVHVLVLEAFVGPRPGPSHTVTCNHKNGIKTDDRLVNLEWVPHRENLHHAFETGLVDADKQQARTPRGERNNQAKLTDAAVRDILATPRSYGSGARLARYYRVTRDTIDRVRNGKTWSHVN
jgi:hypothetical protein